jgi:hypothetical protein
LAKPTGGDWEAVNVGLIANSASRSPFSIANILNDSAADGAKKEIYLFGQSLRFVTRRQGKWDFKKLTLDWLQKDKSRQFHAIVINSERSRVVATSNKVSTDDFEREVKSSTTELNRWKVLAQKKGLNFFVYTTDFVPTSVTFVDPENDFGYMVLSPFAYGAGAGERPHFIVGRIQNAVVFDHFWCSYRDHLWNEQRTRIKGRHRPSVELK